MVCVVQCVLNINVGEQLHWEVWQQCQIPVTMKYPKLGKYQCTGCEPCWCPACNEFYQCTPAGRSFKQWLQYKCRHLRFEIWTMTLQRHQAPVRQWKLVHRREGAICRVPSLKSVIQICGFFIAVKEANQKMQKRMKRHRICVNGCSPNEIPA